MIVICMVCKKEFDINLGDPQYRKLIAKETKYYICQYCNTQIKREAIISNGIFQFL
ncbi:MAG: DUF2197 domain-containing protein [Bacillota bacterium]